MRCLRDVYHTGEREKKQTLCVYKISTNQERSGSKLSRDTHLKKHPQFMKAIDLIPVFTLSFCLLFAFYCLGSTFAEVELRAKNLILMLSKPNTSLDVISAQSQFVIPSKPNLPITMSTFQRGVHPSQCNHSLSTHQNPSL